MTTRAADVGQLLDRAPFSAYQKYVVALVALALLFDGSELQRLWRDVNAAAQHYAFGWDNAMSDYGRVAIGLPALNTIPGKPK